LLSERWQEIPVKEKERYTQLAKKDQERYEIEVYNMKIGLKDLKDLKESKIKKILKKENLEDKSNSYIFINKIEFKNSIKLEIIEQDHQDSE
jgi:hypothetical protein